MKKRPIYKGMLNLIVFLFLFCKPCVAENLSVDFSQRSHTPLVKKFGWFNTGLITQNRNNRDLHLLGYLNSDSLRIDISNGKNNGFSVDPVGGAQGSGNLAYSWTQIDELANLVQSTGTLPYWSFSYVPDPLQQFNGAWRLPPNDLNKWQAASREFASHFKSAGIPGYLEVYNEPDFGDFWQGTREQYFELYRYGAQGFQEGDPDALVGGPALAFTGSWINPFVDFVQSNNLPLDFFSFHAIGPKGSTDNRDFAMGQLSQVRSRLNQNSRFDATESHLNEYSPFFPSGPNDDLVAQPHAATRLLDDYAFFLQQHDVTVVNWAQFMDSGGFDPLGLVDLNGNPKRAFYAAAMIGDLPVEAYSLTTPNGVSSLASANDSQAGILMWNRSGSSHDINVLASMLPFQNARLKLYRVDQNNIPQLGATPDDFLVPIQEYDVISGQPSPLWSGNLNNDGIVYLKIENLDAPVESTLPSPGKVLRLHYYFSDRGTDRFGYFDRDSWTAHLGLGGNPTAGTQVGALVDELESPLHIEFDLSRSDELAAGLGAAIRVDFRDEQQLVYSILVHDGRLTGLNGLLLNTPWTEGKGIDSQIQVPDLSSFDLDLASLAPGNWDGSAVFSFMLSDVFSDTLADISIERLVMPGDFNFDGKVDSMDLQYWQEHFGDVLNGADFLNWQRNFGAGSNLAENLGTSVAEPSAMAIAVLNITSVIIFGGRCIILFR